MDTPLSPTSSSKNNNDNNNKTNNSLWEPNSIASSLNMMVKCHKLVSTLYYYYQYSVMSSAAP